jgi:hypothetical protein
MLWPLCRHQNQSVSSLGIGKQGSLRCLFCFRDNYTQPRLLFVGQYAQLALNFCKCSFENCFHLSLFLWDESYVNFPGVLYLYYTVW